MNAGPDVERRISSWLAEEVPTRAPDRILPAAFERTRHTHQRRFGAAWRSITMNRTWQLATAAVVGVLIIGLGAVWIGGSGGVGGPSGPTPSPTPAPSPFPSSGDVEPGTYVLQGSGSPSITLTMPAGWQSDNGQPVKNNGTSASLTLMPWIVSNITSDPCQWNSDPALSPSQIALLEPPVGPTVDDLASALVKQPLRNATTPTDVTIDRYLGKSLELTIPADLDFATCSGGFFVSWVGATADETMGFAGPGSHDRVLILDVDGVRLVLDAIDFPGARAGDRAELQAIVDSIQIEPVSATPSASPAGSP